VDVVVAFYYLGVYDTENHNSSSSHSVFARFKKIFSMKAAEK